jgi:oligopeptide/dipeptide ABC transporter ATP-binding protein
MGAPLLEVRGLSVWYRTGRRAVRALDDVSFDVQAGETVGLVGESGSGKSTVAKAILGLVPVQAGSVRFAGAEITRLPFKRRREGYRHLQVVFQDPYSSLNPARTIGQTLAEPLRAFGERDRETVRRRVREMLDRVHLSGEVADRYPWQFSGGQRQRIAIARALILSPRLVVLDEAVSSLDLSVQAQVLELLGELQERSALSYLFISHDLDVVRHQCSQVVVLHRGRVVEAGPALRLVSGAAAHPYTQALHEAVPVPDPRVQRERQTVATRGASAASGGVQVRDEQCAYAPRCPWSRPRCFTERPLLRSAGADGMTACHRYPEWRAELERDRTKGGQDGREGDQIAPFQSHHAEAKE